MAMAYGDDAAHAYLQGNAGLRAAVGAVEGDELQPRYLGVGEHNLNYRFRVPSNGRDFVLRVNVAPQPFHDNQVAYEFSALRALQPSGRTPQPVFLDDSPDAPGKGAIVMGFCEGDELDFDHLRPGDLQCAAQIMADVHAVPVPEGCPLHRPADPLRALYEECLQRFQLYRASTFEDARVTRWTESFIKAAGEDLERYRPDDARPGANGIVQVDGADAAAGVSQLHIVNTETLPSHFLIPAAAAEEAARAARVAGSGRFCANPGSFVDWERPVLGEVAQDVAYFVSPTTTFWDSEFLFPSSQVESFVQDYWRAVDGRFPRGNFDDRFRSWRMMTALRSTTWFCRALVHYGTAGTHKTEKTARKIPQYLSDDFMQMLADECFGM